MVCGNAHIPLLGDFAGDDVLHPALVSATILSQLAHAMSTQHHRSSSGRASLTPALACAVLPARSMRCRSSLNLQTPHHGVGRCLQHHYRQVSKRWLPVEHAAARLGRRRLLLLWLLHQPTLHGIHLKHLDNASHSMPAS